MNVNMTRVQQSLVAGSKAVSHRPAVHNSSVYSGTADHVFLSQIARTDHGQKALQRQLLRQRKFLALKAITSHHP